MSDPQPPSNEAAMESLLREQRLGPPADRGDLTPWDFLQRWPPQVQRARVWPVVSRLLTDGDELVRARALQFIRDWSDGADVTTPRVIEVAERHASLFTNQVVEGRSLRDELADTLGVLAIRHESSRIASILRKMATVAPLSGGAVTILARQDPGFVISQAKQWGGRASQWLADAATAIALYHRDFVIPFLRAATHLDESERRRILGLVEMVIKRDDKDAALIANSSGTPVPVKPAPTQAECKRAVGLD